MDEYSYRRALHWAASLGGPLLEEHGAKPPYGMYECGKARLDAAGILRNLWQVENAADLRELAERFWSGLDNPEFQQIRLFFSGLTRAERSSDLAARTPGSVRGREGYVVNLYMDRLPPAGIAAWDLGRLAFYIRCARLARYINEQEEAAYLLHNAVRARFSYRNWADYAVAYMAGCQFSQKDLSEEGSEIRLGRLRRLLTGPKSPWRELEWDIILPEPPALPE
ncbi:DUF1266 domain-containing protein [Saccharibacillus deserti]|uniref:DUF1266 domain-containing protein n=1 Tax=Saccharibacillus deserti TaxID=1634444 RepID=UPI0015545061|nr:DUF1266 domain-containing protein [Saccharibacillus deserti]